MRQQAKYLKSKGKDINDIRVDYNKVQHQNDSHSCGVYALSFLIRMARGDDFDALCSNIPGDEKMQKCRLVYFDKYVHNNK